MIGKIIAGILFGIMLIMISVIDIKKKKIYNEAVAGLFVPVIVSFFVFPEISVISRLLGAISASGIMLFISCLIPGAFGGGDIKMMIPVGLLLGAKHTMLAWITAVLGAGIYSIIYLLIESIRYFRKTENIKKKLYVPFGPFLAIGSAYSFLCM